MSESPKRKVKLLRTPVGELAETRPRPRPPIEAANYIPAPGEPISPEALRTIANWLDVYDRVLESVLDVIFPLDPAKVKTARAVVTGKDVQSDLRRWADEMEQG